MMPGETLASQATSHTEYSVFPQIHNSYLWMWGEVGSRQIWTTKPNTYVPR